MSSIIEFFKNLMTFICRMTLCKIGFHKWGELWNKFSEGRITCSWCGMSHDEYDYY